MRASISPTIITPPRHRTRILIVASLSSRSSRYNGAYEAMAKRGGGVQLAFCWSHVRRQFYDLPGPIAAETLARIAALYKVEAAIRGRSAAERQAVRHARSRPVIEALWPAPIGWSGLNVSASWV